MNGWYITKHGIRVILEPKDSIVVSFRHVVELVIPNGAKNVYCAKNKLTKLIIPDSVEYIDCFNNNLTELIIPDGCYVNCDESVKVINKTMYNRSNRLKAILK